MKKNIVKFIKAHNVITYCILVVFLSIPLFLINCFIFTGLYDFCFPQLAPVLSSIVVLLFLRENQGIIELISKVKKFNMDIKMYLFAIFTPNLILLFTYSIYAKIYNKQFEVTFLSIGVLTVQILGIVCEEIGWRGFMLPRLQRKYSALKSGTIVGLFWAVWHLPVYLIKENLIVSILFIFATVATSILITWIYNNSNGSIVTSILYHLSNNLTFLMLLSSKSKFYSIWIIWPIILWIVVIIKLIIDKKKRCFKFNLHY